MRRGILAINAAVLTGLILSVLIWPPIYGTRVIGSGDLARGEIPAMAYAWHEQLSGALAPWATERVESGRAAGLSVEDIAGTEWPMFSAVFYLWATEALQDAAATANVPIEQQPVTYADAAIRAAAALIADPAHATWVREHWGDAYLERKNLFYRMLLISGLTSFQALLGDALYETQLRAQVTSLAAELDASPYGLLDDYPGQCYPIDIVPAIAAIGRADRVLGTDHSAMIARAVRGFEGDRLDPTTGLPAYLANSRTGQGIGAARGVGVAFMTIWAAEMWPAVAELVCRASTAFLAGRGVGPRSP
ncbi:MAG: hypothetical protein AAFU65_10405 [Pseudomonadota bacterium]